jgi:hypothetical protein
MEKVAAFDWNALYKSIKPGFKKFFNIDQFLVPYIDSEWAIEQKKLKDPRRLEALAKR